MKRRIFFSVFSGSFVFPSFLKWTDLNRDTSVVATDPSKHLAAPTSLEVLVSLNPGQHFVLPKNVTPLKTYVFLNEGQDWQSNPPIVKSEKWLLAGKDEPILVDQNFSFALKYLGKEVGWTLVNV